MRKKKTPNRVLVGRIQKNSAGFAFILPQDRKTPDVYLSKREARSLLNGDIVEFTIHRDGRRSEGEIRRIVERTQKEVLGTLQFSNRTTYVVSPEGDEFVVKTPTQLPRGEWVVARFEEYPTQHQRGVVSIKETLGKQLAPKHDYLIAISRFNLVDSFNESALQQAGECKVRMEADGKPSDMRRDLRSLPFVTIDGEDAKDFDDAILVEQPKEGAGFILYVAIADVSFFVTPGSPLDKAAQSRGTSVYFPGRCLPMLPEALSNDLCSLKPQTDRLVLVAEMHFDRVGHVHKTSFYQGIICTARRMTYTELQGWMDEGTVKHPALQKIEQPLDHARALFRHLLKKRHERGVLDFDLPECAMELDSEGMPIKMGRAKRLDSHKLIEEFMIVANQQVAKALLGASIETLYRIHEAPDPTSLEEVNFLLRNLGISRTIKEVSPKAFSEILRLTSGVKGALTLHQAILRLQKQARYHPDPVGHFGLALRDYCHFTSPIRRYPDLEVHRSLKRLILKQKNTDKRNDEAYFNRIGELTSDRERRAMEAERFVVKRKQCWFMQKHLGERFNGQIAGIIPRGVFVELPEFALEGFLPLESLQGVYEYDEDKKCLRRRPGHSLLTVGDKLSIEVVRVAPEDNEIEFAQNKT